MIFFDIIMTLIEDFILAYFDFKTLNIINNKLVIFLTLVCTIVTFIFNNLLLNNYWLMIILIVIFTFISSFYHKKSKNRIIRINTGILSNMKQKIKEFYH